MGLSVVAKALVSKAAALPSMRVVERGTFCSGGPVYGVEVRTVGCEQSAEPSKVTH
jgi:hypothetical protein